MLVNALTYSVNIIVKSQPEEKMQPHPLAVNVLPPQLNAVRGSDYSKKKVLPVTGHEDPEGE